MATSVQTQLNEHVLQFLSKPKKMLIDGKWVEAVSGKTFATLDPSTEEPLAQIAEGDKHDADLAVKAARRAFETGPWSKMTASERGRLIWKLADLIEQNLDPDLPAIHADSNQLHQALLNLAINARDAMPQGGTLAFQTETERLARAQIIFRRAQAVFTTPGAGKIVDDFVSQNRKLRQSE